MDFQAFFGWLYGFLWFRHIFVPDASLYNINACGSIHQVPRSDMQPTGPSMQHRMWGRTVLEETGR